MKVQAKKNISLYKKALKETGGGSEQTEPGEIDFIIQDMLPHEFVEDTSKFDSDAVCDIPSVSFNYLSKFTYRLKLSSKGFLLLLYKGFICNH